MSKTNSGKTKDALFNQQGWILGNVSLEFSNGSKKMKSCTKWKDLTKSEKITGKNFLIVTGKKSGITVFDVDIKKDKNAEVGLAEAGLDLDDYQNECIKVKTPSGGWHYIFNYDARFKTSANAYGIEGLDIRNDDGIIFAGENYDIENIGDDFFKKSLISLDEINEMLTAHHNEVNPKTEKLPNKITQIIKNFNNEKTIPDESFGINQKYFDLCMLLEDKYFNHYDLWIKILYAIRNVSLVDNEIGEVQALNTIIKLFDERSDSPNKNETIRLFNLEEKTKQRFNIGSIVNILKKDADKLKLWQQWNETYCKKRNVVDEVKEPTLLEKLNDIVKDIYKREYNTGAIYEKVHNYYYVRKYASCEEWLNVIFKDDENYHKISQQQHKQLIYQIKKIHMPNFPFINNDSNNNYIGFNNGVFNLSNGAFIEMDDVDENIQVRKYIDTKFDINNDHAPKLDAYLDFQFEKEDQEFIYFILGRHMTKLDDRFDFITLLYGTAGSGKSLLLNLLKYTYAPNQVGILSSSHQERFGLSEVANKQILCCDDIDNLAKTLPKTDFLSMATRGSINCPIKCKESIQVDDWNISTIINSNSLPNYKDTSGEIVRRFMIVNFKNAIPTNKMNCNLEYEIKKEEFAVFVKRCRLTYLDYIKKYNGQNVNEFAPENFLYDRDELRMATNNTFAFVSDKCTYKEDASISMKQLNICLKEYLMSKYDCQFKPKDTINVSSLLMVDPRYEEKKIMTCKSCLKPHKKGCCDAYTRTNRTSQNMILNIMLNPNSNVSFDDE